MPEVKLDRVVSVSSEDNNFPAANLLGKPGSGKWKSSKAGEKNLSVIIQFKNPAKISSIHVGNECSAFIEVLVGKESASSPSKKEDWQVLLVASSLMTPSDARSNTNTQRVRLFNIESLSKSASSGSWDRAKVICTQPFNKSQSYGLSFISFLTDDESASEEKDNPRTNSQKLGAFTLNEDTDSDDPAKATGGTMFSDRARLKASEPPATAAAAVRAAARDADIKVGIKKESKVSKTSADKSPITVGRKAEAKPQKRTASPAETEKPKSKVAKPEPSAATATPKVTKPAAAAAGVTVPFKELMKGVVFTLSGFKNPKRSDLREKAVEMGAKYIPDWNTKCTHLVCAFTSTPKFTQVNGKGYIVGEDWVLDSHRRKQKLPWRDYRLGRARSPPRAKEDDEKDKARSKVSDEKKATPATAVSSKPSKAADEYAGSTDIDSDVEEEEKANNDTQVDSDATEIDTDDEIAAHLADSPKSRGKQPASGKVAPTKTSNGSAASTGARRPLPVLPDYLLDRVFFLYGNLSNRHGVYRYIHAYGGQVEEYMCDQVQYVVTDDKWDENFDSALNDNGNLTFVKSKWIVDIHSQQKFIPHQKYAIVPS